MFSWIKLNKKQNYVSQKNGSVAWNIIVLNFIHPYKFLISAIIEYQNFMKMQYSLLILCLDKPSLKPENNRALKSVKNYFKQMLMVIVHGLN